MEHNHANQEYAEDCACLREHSLDVEGDMWYMEFDHSYGFEGTE